MIEMIQGDCMEIMKDYPDDYFDLACVDPPYRNTSENQPTKDMRNNGSMRNFGDKPTIDYFNELRRISKNQIIWGANNFQLPGFKGFVVWRKLTISENFTMSMCEIASISEDLGTTSKWIEIAPQDKYRIHPTQKPVQLYKWLLHNYAKPGQKIFDSHGGSGSSAIAAHYYGVDMVWIELDQEYYDLACERFKRETSQTTLF